MAIVNSLLLAAHMLGLVLIVGAAFVLWRAGDLFARGEGSSGLARFGGRAYMLGNVGLTINWISGPILIFSKYGGWSAFVDLGSWFWLKLALVIALSGFLGVAGANFRRATGAKPTAAAKASGIGGIALLAGLGVILASAFAFG